MRVDCGTEKVESTSQRLKPHLIVWRGVPALKCRPIQCMGRAKPGAGRLRYGDGQGKGSGSAPLPFCLSYWCTLGGFASGCCLRVGSLGDGGQKLVRVLLLIQRLLQQLCVLAEAELC